MKKIYITILSVILLTTILFNTNINIIDHSYPFIEFDEEDENNN